jgi:hypothetical protein
MMYEEKGVCLYVCRHWDEEVLGLGKLRVNATRVPKIYINTQIHTSVSLCARIS